MPFHWDCAGQLTDPIQVIQKIGLCISFYDLLESSDGLIGHGTGLVNVNGKVYFLYTSTDAYG